MSFNFRPYLPSEVSGEMESIITAMATIYLDKFKIVCPVVYTLTRRYIKHADGRIEGHFSQVVLGVQDL